MIHPARTAALALVLTWFLALGAPVEGQDPADAPPARNLILIIADGGGVGTWTVARLALGDALAVARMPVVGLVDTRNMYGGLTDSAAGATALSGYGRSTGRSRWAPSVVCSWKRIPWAAS